MKTEKFTGMFNIFNSILKTIILKYSMSEAEELRKIRREKKRQTLF